MPSATLRTATLLAALLALTACQQGGGHGGGGGARPAPDLAGAFARTYGARAAEPFPAAQRADVARCIGQAMAHGIPLNDQFLIYDQIDAGKTTPLSKAAMQRWVGGPIVEGDQSSAFNTGANANTSSNRGAPAARIDANLRQFCSQYKDRLLKAGYVGDGSGPGSGFSNKK